MRKARAERDARGWAGWSWVSAVAAAGVLALAGCSSSSVGSAGACGRSAADLDRLDASGRPAWISDIFAACAVGSADWASSGGKEAGESAARSTAVTRLASSMGKQKIKVVEQGSSETAYRGNQVTQEGVSKASMQSESEEVTLKVRTVRRWEQGYTIYVLVERQ